MTEEHLSRVGAALLLSHGRAALVVAGIVVLSAALGHALVRRADRTGAASDLPSVLAVPIGASAIGAAMLVLGVLGWLQTPAIGASLAVLAAVSGPGWRCLRERIPRVRELWRVAGSFPIAVAAGLGLGTLGLVTALLPPWDPDSLTYHVAVPLEYLSAGRVYLPPDNLHAIYANSIQFLYVPLLAFGGLVAPALLNAVMLLLLAWLVAKAGDELLGSGTGDLASALMWSSTVLILVGVTPRIDVTVTYFVFSAHYALWLAWRRRSFPYLAIYALLAGLAAGAKATAILYVVATLVPASVILASMRHVGWARVMKQAAVMASLAVLAYAPWYLKNAWLLESWDAVLIGDRVAPWIAELLHETRRSEVPGFGVQNWHGEAREPFSLGAFFTDPGSITIEAEAGSYYAGLVMALAPICLFLRERRAVLFLLTPPAFFLALVLLRSTTVNTRYLLPMIPALTIAGAAVLDRLVRAGFVRARGVARATAVILLLIPTAIVVAARTVTFRPFSHALGIESGETTLNRFRDLGVPTFANGRLTADDRVLMIGTGVALYYDVPTLRDTHMNAWPLLVSGGLTRGCLEQAGITHVVEYRGHHDVFQSRGADMTNYRWDAFDEFHGRCLELVLESPRERLYRVRRGQPDR